MVFCSVVGNGTASLCLPILGLCPGSCLLLHGNTSCWSQPGSGLSQAPWYSANPVPLPGLCISGSLVWILSSNLKPFLTAENLGREKQLIQSLLSLLGLGATNLAQVVRFSFNWFSLHISSTSTSISFLALSSVIVQVFRPFLEKIGYNCYIQSWKLENKISTRQALGNYRHIIILPLINSVRQKNQGLGPSAFTSLVEYWSSPFCKSVSSGIAGVIRSPMCSFPSRWQQGLFQNAQTHRISLLLYTSKEIECHVLMGREKHISAMFSCWWWRTRFICVKGWEKFFFRLASRTDKNASVPWVTFIIIFASIWTLYSTLIFASCSFWVELIKQRTGVKIRDADPWYQNTGCFEALVCLMSSISLAQLLEADSSCSEALLSHRDNSSRWRALRWDAFLGFIFCSQTQLEGIEGGKRSTLGKQTWVWLWKLNEDLQQIYRSTGCVNPSRNYFHCGQEILMGSIFIKKKIFKMLRLSADRLGINVIGNFFQSLLLSILLYYVSYYSIMLC